MVRGCTADDFDRILAIINDAATAYRGIIPDDRWKEPYMPAEELADEIAAGIDFDGYEIAGTGLVGVMGVQMVEDVSPHPPRLRRDRSSAVGDRVGTVRRIPGAGGASDPDRYVGGRDLGDRFLPAARVRAGPA